MTPLHDSLCAQSVKRDEDDDCSVIALAAGAGISYAKAHRLCALAGREHRGAPATWWRYLAAWEVIGAQLDAVPRQDYCECVTVRQLLRRPFMRDGRYLVATCRQRDYTSHVFVVEDGEMHDGEKILRRRGIHTIWRIRRWSES